MTIRDWCDASLALIVEDFQRQGILLSDAWDRLREWTTGEAEYQEGIGRDRRAAAIPRPADNDAALGAITAALAGTS